MTIVQTPPAIENTGLVRKNDLSIKATGLFKREPPND